MLSDFSVVFARQEWRTAPDGVTEFTRADLHRVDLVLEGSVPGAQLLAFRPAHHLGGVAARIAHAERLTMVGITGEPDTAQALREADETLDRLEG